MAYLRRGGPEHSDVSLYMDVDGYLTCLNCSQEYRSGYPQATQQGRRNGRHACDYLSSATADMADHLCAHVAAGDNVPFIDDVIAELWADDAENFTPPAGSSAPPATADSAANPSPPSPAPPADPT